MELSIVLLVATFFMAFISSVLSGIAGGGGGFIMAPWQLLIGFSPIQMVATGSVGGSSIAAGSLLALRKLNITTDKFPTFLLSVIAVASSLVASAVLPHIDTEVFKLSIAIITILSLPLFFSTHTRFNSGQRSARSRRAGYGIMCLLLVLGAILFSSTFSLLTALALPFFFGMNIHVATSVRRTIALVQMIVLAVMLHQYIVWIYLIASVTGGFLGSYIGTHIAVKNGESFAQKALATGAVVSALALVL